MLHLTHISFAADPGWPSGTLPSTVTNNKNALDLANLAPLMKLCSGRTETTIALIDGPVATDHPDLLSTNIREIPSSLGGTCSEANSIACMHGTFVAGILSARRGSSAPSIAPDCTLLVRPIFAESASGNRDMPSATPEELATAIIDSTEAGAHVINLSASLSQPSANGERKLRDALDSCARRDSVVVAAAGNEASIGSSTITRHPWVIPVVACDLRGQPMAYSNFGNSIGRRGLSAPGDGITSISPAAAKAPALSGTSVAAPFVTGAIALLRSLFPTLTGAGVKFALMGGHARRRTTIVPTLLDAWAAYQILQQVHK